MHGMWYKGAEWPNLQIGFVILMAKNYVTLLFLKFHIFAVCQASTEA